MHAFRNADSVDCETGCMSHDLLGWSSIGCLSQYFQHATLGNIRTCSELQGKYVHIWGGETRIWVEAHELPWSLSHVRSPCAFLQRWGQAYCFFIFFGNNEFIAECSFCLMRCDLRFIPLFKASACLFNLIITFICVIPFLLVQNFHYG